MQLSQLIPDKNMSGFQLKDILVSTFVFEDLKTAIQKKVQENIEMEPLLKTAISEEKIPENDELEKEEEKNKE